MEDRLEKLELLKDKFRNMGSALVAYSGGVDSTLLLKIGHDTLGDLCIGVMAISESYTPEEANQALEIAKLMDMPVIQIYTEELQDERFATNASDRCYFCKSELFVKLEDLAKERNIKYIVYGENVDDTGDFRPGSLAANEHKVSAPLKEVGMSKDDIRYLARILGLPNWNKPSMACLASRIPYGTRITFEALQKVNQAEHFISSLGFRQLRVRHHGKIARIEVLPEDIERLSNPEVRELVDAKLREIGYTYVTLDLRGYRTGSMNESIGFTKETSVSSVV